MASGYSFSSTTDPDNNTLAYDKNGRLKIISVPPVDVSVTNPITNDNNTLGLNYDNVTLNLSSGTGAPLQINLANANTWTATQTFPVASFSNLLSTANTWTAQQTFSLPPLGQVNLKQQATGEQNWMYFINSLGSTLQVLETGSSGSDWQLDNTGNTIFANFSGISLLTITNAGNVTITKSGAGIVSTNGIKTTAGAATAVTVGASPYTYINSSTSNQQIFIQGGTVSAISFNPNGGTGISLSGLTDNVITMRPNDTLTITYTAAPTVNTIQL